jgi:hypothetical protein
VDQDIKGKSNPEQNHMPGFQVPGDTFCPNPKGIKNQGSGDKNGSEKEQHIYPNLME